MGHYDEQYAAQAAETQRLKDEALAKQAATNADIRQDVAANLALALHVMRTHTSTRESSLVITKIEEAMMWLNKVG